MTWGPNGVQLWSSDTGLLVKSLHHGTALVRAISPDQSRIITSGRDEYIRIWLPTGEMIERVIGMEFMKAIAMAPDNQAIAAGSTNGSIKLINLNTHTSRVLIRRPYPVEQLVFSGDGLTLYARWSDRILSKVDIETGHVLCEGSGIDSPIAILGNRLIDYSDGFVNARSGRDCVLQERSYQKYAGLWKLEPSSEVVIEKDGLGANNVAVGRVSPLGNYTVIDHEDGSPCH